MVSHSDVKSSWSSTCGHVRRQPPQGLHGYSHSIIVPASLADEESPRKKHKKNKHKKRKTREDVTCGEGEAAEERVMEVAAAPGGRPLTLKIKLGGKPVPTAASR